MREIVKPKWSGVEGFYLSIYLLPYYDDVIGIIIIIIIMCAETYM